MTKYFLRRLLLLVPTFFGSTIVVFVILQLAPGGPIEQAILRMKMSGMTRGDAGGGGARAGITEATIPAAAMEQMRKFYGFDKPIPTRYLMWLGLWPREIERRSLELGGAWKAPAGEVEAAGEKVRLWRWVKAVDESGHGAVVESEEIGAGYSPDGSVPVLPPALRVARWRPSTEWKVLGDWSARPDGPKKLEIGKRKFSGILTGDLGESYVYAESVWKVIQPRFKISLFFGLTGFVLAYLVCIPLGILKALRHGSVFDLLTSVVVFIGYSIPGWALGAILLVLFGGGSLWNVFPLGGFRSDNWESLDAGQKLLDQLHHAALPLVAWTIQGFAVLTILMKNSLLENLGADYVRTAFAKGLPERRVIWVHVMRNSLIPICVGIGHVISVFLAGSYLIEKAFNINGFGMLGYQSALARDYPIVMGVLVIGVLLLLVGNILSDLALAIVDPRIRFQ